MFEDDNKRFLISFHHIFVIWVSRDWLQAIFGLWIYVQYWDEQSEEMASVSL